MRSFGSKKPTRAAGEASFAMWLPFAPAHEIADDMVEPVARRHGLDRKFVEYKFIQERKRRQEAGQRSQ